MLQVLQGQGQARSWGESAGGSRVPRLGCGSGLGFHFHLAVWDRAPHALRLLRPLSGDRACACACACVRMRVGGGEGGKGSAGERAGWRVCLTAVMKLSLADGKCLVCLNPNKTFGGTCLVCLNPNKTFPICLTRHLPSASESSGVMKSSTPLSPPPLLLALPLPSPLLSSLRPPTRSRAAPPLRRQVRG
jgi:hypothetical protein